MDASEIYSKRFSAKEVTFPKQNGKFIFPVADGRTKFVGGDPFEHWFCKVPVLHDDKLLCFDCTDQTKHTMRRTCQHIVNTDSLCLSRALKVGGLPGLLGLEISFQEWFSTIECSM